MSQDFLLDLLNKNKVSFELVVFKESVKDSKSSASASNFALDRIVKTILFVDKSNNVFSVIIRSSERVCRHKVRSFFDCSKLSLIGFDDVSGFVGFPAGGVPPFGYSAKFIIDSDLGDDEEVLVGGGTIYSLIRIRVRDIKKLCNPLVGNVKQD